MQYVIDVLDSDGQRVAELGGLVSARLREKVNGIGSLSVESLDPRGRDVVEPGISRLRIRPAPGNAATFRVIEAAHERKRERRSLRITARHVLGDTGDELFAETAVCVNQTPAAILAQVLVYSAFSAGASAYIDPIPYVRFEYEPVHDCLMRLCGLTGGELRLDEATGEIHLDAPSTGGGRVIRYGIDLLSALRTADTSGVANRVYGVGGGDPPLTLTGASQSGGSEYIGDAESVAMYGLRTAVYRNSSIDASIDGGADLLYELTARYLDAHKAPVVSCAIEMIHRDVAGGDPVIIGEPVTVIDPSFDEPVQARVIERNLDLLKPWHVDVRLDTL